MILMSWKQLCLYVVAAGMALLTYLYGVIAVMLGWWWLMLPAALVLSPGIMALLRVVFERPFGLTGFTNPRVMSYSYVVGGFVLLPLALSFAAFGWTSISTVGWHYNMRFFWTAFACGVLVAVVIFMIDGRRYKLGSVPTARRSPTKVWHDWAVTPSLAALFVWLLAPQLASEWTDAVVVSLMCLASFAAIVAYDAVVPPIPALQHPVWDSQEFEVVIF